MKRLSLMLFFLSIPAFAQSVHMKVSPFVASLPHENPEIKIHSAEILLMTEFCLFTESCQAGPSVEKAFPLAVKSVSGELEITLEKRAGLTAVRAYPFKIQTCSLLILIHATHAKGASLLGRLPVGSFGSSSEECSDSDLADNAVRTYFMSNPNITWLQ